MRFDKNCLVTIIALVAAAWLARPARAQNQWPLEDVTVVHPLGSTFGEFQRNEESTGYYLHEGIDVLGSPAIDDSGGVDSTAPFVCVVVPGKIKRIERSLGSRDNYVTIEDANGILYRYGHLDHGSFQTKFDDDATDLGKSVVAGEKIARVVRWEEHDGACEFHHVHYDIYDPATREFLSPLPDPSATSPTAGQVSPNADAFSPRIERLLLATDDASAGRWNELEPAPGGKCTPVDGAVDILVEARDEYPGGSALTGSRSTWVRTVRWRASPDTAPAGAWRDTLALDAMSADWANPDDTSVSSDITRYMFSTSYPWESSDDYCVRTTFFAIATNYVGGVPDYNGAWDTTDGADGGYTVSVKLVDYAGNSSIHSRRVCVKNDRACGAELLIRDAADDDGTLPYRGAVGWLSPDILVNAGTADEEIIREATSNTIEVRVWNNGCADVLAGTPVTVTLGWGAPGGTLPATNVIAASPVTLSVDWPVGSSRSVPFAWTPATGSLPLGHACLKAWVETEDDPINTEMSVIWDDNKAQRNITFAGGPPPPGSAAASSSPPAPPEARSAAFTVHPLPGVSARRLEIRVEPPERGPVAFQRLRLHVGPGLVPASVEGGRLVGGHDEKTSPGDPQDPGAPCARPDLSWEEASTLGCTRILEALQPAGGRLVLAGVRLESPVLLRLEGLAAGALPGGAVVDVHVVEYGRPSTHPEVTPLGGLTVRFRR